jgi:hypothetical protein
VCSGRRPAKEYIGNEARSSLVTATNDHDHSRHPGFRPEESRSANEAIHWKLPATERTQFRGRRWSAPESDDGPIPKTERTQFALVARPNRPADISRAGAHFLPQVVLLSRVLCLAVLSRLASDRTPSAGTKPIPFAGQTHFAGANKRVSGRLAERTHRPRRNEPNRGWVRSPAYYRTNPSRAGVPEVPPTGLEAQPAEVNGSMGRGWIVEGPWAWRLAISASTAATSSGWSSTSRVVSAR